MKYIKTFLENRTRSEKISESDFFRIIKESCQEWLKDKPYIVRAVESDRGQYLSMTPSVYNRKYLPDTTSPISHLNYNKIFLDDLKSWKEFPKRDNSIIGLYDETKTQLSEDFGEFVYLIIPFDGAKFGCAPVSDIWFSHISGVERKRLNDRFSIFLNDANISDNSIEDFIEDIHKHLNKISDNDGYDFIRDFFDFGYREYTIEEVYNQINKVLAPSNIQYNGRGFKVLNIEELSKLNYNSEVWTESKCLLYQLDSNNVNKSYRDFIRLF